MSQAFGNVPGPCQRSVPIMRFSFRGRHLFVIENPGTAEPEFCEQGSGHHHWRRCIAAVPTMICGRRAAGCISIQHPCREIKENPPISAKSPGNPEARSILSDAFVRNDFLFTLPRPDEQKTALIGSQDGSLGQCWLTWPPCRRRQRMRLIVCIHFRQCRLSVKLPCGSRHVLSQTAQVIYQKHVSNTLFCG